MNNYEDFGNSKQIRRENEIILCGGKEFKVNTFFVIIDKLNYELDK